MTALRLQFLEGGVPEQFSKHIHKKNSERMQNPNRTRILNFETLKVFLETVHLYKSSLRVYLQKFLEIKFVEATTYSNHHRKLI